MDNKVHGAVFELFKVDSVFSTAVEVSAGQGFVFGCRCRLISRLFHMVVDDDEVAAVVLKSLMALPGGGRVTMMPMNRLKYKAVSYPASTREAIPLISKLEFDPRYDDVD